MALCPEKHENPQLFTRCRVCGLPIIDLKAEFGLLAERLAAKANLARPKAMNVLVGIGSLGVELVQLERAMRGDLSGADAYVYVDTKAPTRSGIEAGDTFGIQLGGMIAGSSTFCGVAEAEAAKDSSLQPLLRNAGLRDADDKQGVFAAVGLGGGTGSGVIPVLLSNSLALNPSARCFVVGVLPSAEESFHSQLNAYYAVSRMLNSGNGPLAEAIIAIQYDRLKWVRGVGRGGEELKLESLLATLLSLLSTTLTFPNSAKLARLNRSARTQLLVPCLALGRSMEIFGTLGNVLDSAIAFPLAEVDRASVLSCYMLLRVPQGLTGEFNENTVAEQFSGLVKRHLPMVRSSMYLTATSDDPSDRVDACLLLGSEAWRALHSSREGHERFKAQVSRVSDWGLFGLSGETVSGVQRTLEDYDARLDEMRRQ